MQVIASETKLEPGEMTFSMAIPHYYDRHVEELKKQIEFYYENKERIDTEDIEIEIDLTKGFYEISADDVKIKGYAQRDDLPKRKFDIAE